MKQIKVSIIAVLCIAVLQSCGSSSATNIQDKQLSSFMLGGIYFFNGYGGIDQVTGMMDDAGYTTNEELVRGYKQILEFPFTPSQGSSIKRTFKTMWDISNKQELLKSIGDLKTREHPYKSWDYARIVNNTCMGYAAGFLTKEEVIKINGETLLLAQEKYKDWESYFIDFNKGRVEWNPEDKEAAVFEKLSSTMTTYENSIYTILPLQ